jgi:NDP-sugar pyrophosphorylase family protein
VTILGPSIVGERAAIEPRARLERAILWEGSQIGAGAELRDAVVGANFAVSPGAKIDNALVAMDE